MSLRAFLRSLLVATWCAALCAAPASAQSPALTSSVVKLDVVSDPPDLLAPWQTEGIDLFGGSGVIIEGNRILTNAHVVSPAESIPLAMEPDRLLQPHVELEVVFSGQDERHVARLWALEGEGDEDLALLKIEQELAGVVAQRVSTRHRAK